MTLPPKQNKIQGQISEITNLLVRQSEVIVLLYCSLMTTTEMSQFKKHTKKNISRKRKTGMVKGKSCQTSNG